MRPIFRQAAACLLSLILIPGAWGAPVLRAAAQIRSAPARLAPAAPLALPAPGPLADALPVVAALPVQALPPAAQSHPLGELAQIAQSDPRAEPGARFDGRSVLVIGAGIGGMTAAHELAERGFNVTVIEHGTVTGGKARSVEVPGSGVAGRPNLSGEHGFRIFPGAYLHFYDTLARVPGPDGKPAVSQMFLPEVSWMARDQGREPIKIPSGKGPSPWSKTRSANGLLAVAGSIAKKYGFSLPASEVALFGRKMLYLLTASPARRLAELETLSWWQYLEADAQSVEYQKMFAMGTARTLLAMKPTVASARIVGEMIIQLMYSHVSKERGGVDPMLMGPSNTALFDPWQKHLESKFKTRFSFSTDAVSFNLREGQIDSVTVRGPDGERALKADYYVSALPLDVMQRMATPELVKNAPELSKLPALRLDTMIGLQLYLREELPLPTSHAFLLDSPWATALVYNQTQVWKNYSLSGAGDGTIKSVISVTFGDVDTPGVLFGKPLSKCTAEEILKEAVAQIDQHLGPALAGFVAKNLHAYHFDPAAKFDENGTTSAEPLFINSVGSRYIRPRAQTKIPNLILSADYVLTDFEISSTMEAASAAGRSAAIAVLEQAQWAGPMPRLFTLAEPFMFRALRRLDALFFKLGLPHPFAWFLGKPPKATRP